MPIPAQTILINEDAAKAPSRGEGGAKLCDNLLNSYSKADVEEQKVWQRTEAPLLSLRGRRWRMGLYKLCRLSLIALILASASVFFFLSSSITSGFAFCTKRSLLSFLSTEARKPLRYSSSFLSSSTCFVLSVKFLSDS